MVPGGDLRYSHPEHQHQRQRQRQIQVNGDI